MESPSGGGGGEGLTRSHHEVSVSGCIPSDGVREWRHGRILVRCGHIVPDGSFTSASPYQGGHGQTDARVYINAIAVRLTTSVSMLVNSALAQHPPTESGKGGLTEAHPCLICKSLHPDSSM